MLPNGALLNSSQGFMLAERVIVSHELSFASRGTLRGVW